MKGIISYQIVFIAIIFVGLVPFTGCYKQPIEEKQVNVVFRFDDYSARSSTVMELRIIEAFRKIDSSITFGVIPFVCAGDLLDPSPVNIVPLTSIKGDILKTGVKEGILDIALHGYSHQTINNEQRTEFSGLDYNSQVERLSEGKKFLERMIDVPITIFVPPFNSYDLNTLRALKKLGFSTLSAGKYGEATESSKLNFLPNSCGLSQLRDAVIEARSSSDTQPLIVVLFHEYDFQEIDKEHGSITYQEFSDLLHWLKTQKYIRLLSISQATNVIKDLSVNRYLLSNRMRKRLDSISSFLPSFLQGEKYTRLYQEKPSLSQTHLVVGVFYLLTIAGLGTVGSFVIGFFVFQRSSLIMSISKFGSTVLSTITLIYVFHDLQVYLNGMMISAGVIGVSIGIWLCSLYLMHKRV